MKNDLNFAPNSTLLRKDQCRPTPDLARNGRFRRAVPDIKLHHMLLMTPTKLTSIWAFMSFGSGSINHLGDHTHQRQEKGFSPQGRCVIAVVRSPRSRPDQGLSPTKASFNTNGTEFSYPDAYDGMLLWLALTLTHGCLKVFRAEMRGQIECSTASQI